MNQKKNVENQSYINHINDFIDPDIAKSYSQSDGFYKLHFPESLKLFEDQIAKIIANTTGRLIHEEEVK
ncbi:MAG: hypothetical protein ACFFB2_02365 [Promethearchaeota archaeon]